MNATDVRGLFERGAREVFDKPRGDENLTHVADFFGCPLETKARLMGLPMLAPSVATLALWHQGHAGEAFIARSLEPMLKKAGWFVERDVLFWIAAANDEDIWGGRLDRDAYDAKPRRLVDRDTGNELNPAHVAVGHADLVATKGPEGLVLEAKTEKQKAAKDVRPKYALQNSSYTFALPRSVKTAVVGVIDRRTGDYAFYDVDHGSYLHEIAPLATRAIALYASDEMPPAEPPAEWMCSFCAWGGCPKNKNDSRNVLTEDFF